MREKSAIIVGAGGHAKVLYECLCLQGVNIIGFTDKCPPRGFGR